MARRQRKLETEGKEPMLRTDVTRRTSTAAEDFDRYVDEREREMLRQIVRGELRTHTGQRTLSREIGIDRGSLRKFADGRSAPATSTLRRLREWAADRPEKRVPMPLVGLALLVEDLPSAVRATARRRVAACLETLYRDAGVGAPTWITDESTGSGLAAVHPGYATEREVLLRIRDLVGGYEAAE
jgi:hypothetical protein